MARFGLDDLGASCDDILTLSDDPHWRTAIFSASNCASTVLDWYVRSASGANDPTDAATLTEVFADIGDRVINVLYFKPTNDPVKASAFADARDVFASVSASARASIIHWKRRWQQRYVDYSCSYVSQTRLRVEKGGCILGEQTGRIEALVVCQSSIDG